MGKPRPPLIDKNKRYYKASAIDVTKNRFEILEGEHQKNDLPQTYIALEALSALSAGKFLGFSNNQMRGIWTDSWGEEEIIVPAKLLNTIAEAWMSYKDSPTGRTMGEAFELEGGGQGKASAHQLQKNRDQRRGTANHVEDIYLTASKNGFPISEERAIEDVAIMQNLSFDTVQKRHKIYKKSIRHKLKKAGVIIY